jgi:uncharacterized protein (DUF1800 family)
VAVVAPYDKTAVPTARQLHVLNRLGCGYSRTAFKQLRNAGGELPWFEAQLSPETITENATADALTSWFPGLAEAPEVIWDNDRTGVKRHWEYAIDLASSSLLRRIHSRRSLFESMVEFWSNHLHVDSRSFPAFCQRASYDQVIRTHALGRFSDLLVAASLHPAMLLFLDNYKSVRGAPNENQGRELLELHTVGRDAGYTEQMVKDSAKILSGWTVVNGYAASTAPAWSRTYDPTRHTTGPVTVLGFSSANASADGSTLTEGYLRYLATHPATAQRIARKLAVRFVSDTPSDALVASLAKVFLDSGTDIKAVLRALVASEEFWASAGAKVRTPIDDVVATCRTLRVVPQAPTTKQSFANALVWTIDSTLPYQWPRPDGPPDTQDVWAAPTRMLNSWRMHWDLAGGWWPSQEATYLTPASYLPQTSIRFDKFVDHLSRVLLGRGSTSVLLDAACEGTGTGVAEVVTVDHAVIRWKFYRLVGTLLDSPQHMTR